ncbi:hypothetical protein [Actinacidiphila glaucinigra]|uniref:hypothetical protein n=1 Tax=Actinacidiphila glaucinigra TaxID=235986 RepID=UPI00382E7A5D
MDLPDAGSRIAEDGRHDAGDVVRPAPNGRAIVSFFRIVRAASDVNSGLSRNEGRTWTTGRSDQSKSDSEVLVAVIFDTVICDRSTRPSSFPYSQAYGGHVGQVVGGHAHREVHPRDALQCGRHRLGPGQVAVDDLCTEPAQLGGSLVLRADHEPHRHVMLAQVVEDRAADATGAGDGDKMFAAISRFPWCLVVQVNR